MREDNEDVLEFSAAILLASAAGPALWLCGSVELC